MAIVSRRSRTSGSTGHQLLNALRIDDERNVHDRGARSITSCPAARPLRQRARRSCHPPPGGRGALGCTPPTPPPPQGRTRIEAMTREEPPVSLSAPLRRK